MEKSSIERMHIREVIENWVLWRDAGDWERFRTVWHPEGRMMATWFQGPAERFIEVSREGWNKDVSILHFLGGSSIDIAEARAIAQTRLGFTVKRDMPMLKGSTVKQLYDDGAAWLAGKPLSR